MRLENRWMQSTPDKPARHLVALQKSKTNELTPVALQSGRGEVLCTQPASVLSQYGRFTEKHGLLQTQ